MILDMDSFCEYFSELTFPAKKAKKLEFALIQFRSDSKIHCIVRKRLLDGLYSVFIKGRDNYGKFVELGKIKADIRTGWEIVKMQERII